MNLTAGTRTRRPGRTDAGPDCWLAGMLLACVLAAAVAPAAEPAPQTADTLPACFSVIGAVPAPATYTTERSPVLLGELIDRAGGLNEQASGTIRIFQRGRREQEFPRGSNCRTVEVVPGAVIVVDSTTTRPHAGAGSGPDYCDVACLSLLDRPLVRRILPDEATPALLLKSLGQPDALAASVRVMRKSRLTAGASGRLNSGDVLVFDPSVVDRAALQAALARAPLQDVQPLDSRPVGETNSAAAVDEIAVERTRDALTLPAVVPVAAIANEPGTEVHASRRASLEINSTYPEEEPIPAPPMDAVAVTAPAQGGPFVARSIGTAIGAATDPGSGTTVPEYPGKPDVDGSAARPAPRPPREAASDPFPARPSATSDAARQAVPAPPGARSTPNSSTSSGAMATAITAGLCAFFALTLLTVWSRRNRGRKFGLRISSLPPIPAVVGPPTASVTAPLDEMINDTMPLVEEAPAFPANMSFHGRTLGFRYLLLSGPHGLHGPHFTAGQISPRLRDHAGAGGARTASRPLHTTWAPASAADPGERREDEADAPTTDIVQPEAEARPPGNGRRQPSPLERALLARRGRNRS